MATLTHSKDLSCQEKVHECVQRDTVVKRKSVRTENELHTIICGHVKISPDIAVGDAGFGYTDHVLACKLRRRIEIPIFVMTQ